MIIVCKVVSDFAHFNVDDQSLCVRVCMSVSLASDSSETVEVIIIKLGMTTASDMRMHDVLIVGHTYLNHEDNKCSIISDTVQAIPIKFAMKIV